MKTEGLLGSHKRGREEDIIMPTPTTPTQDIIIEEVKTHKRPKTIFGNIMGMGDPSNRNRSPSDYALVEDLPRFTIKKCLSQGPKGVEYLVEGWKSKEEFKVVLRDAWTTTPLLPPSTTINLLHIKKDENSVYTLERDCGFLVVEPDRLVSVTSVTGTNWCERKTVLSEVFRIPVDNVVILRGTMAHDLMCRVLLKKSNNQPLNIQKEVEEVLQNPEHLERAYGLGLSPLQYEALGKELIPYMEKIPSGPSWDIKEAVDIEDCLYDPRFGLKGKVDCTVKIKGKGKGGFSVVVPLELKTGNPQGDGKSSSRIPKTDHLAQVQLYSLMMDLIGDNNTALPIGLLYYIREMQNTEIKHPSTNRGLISLLQSLIMARNRIVLHLNELKEERGFKRLPRPRNVDFKKQCSSCDYRGVCALSLKTTLNEQIDSDDPLSPTENSLISSLSFLSPEELTFFSRWVEIIKLEIDADEETFTLKNLWLKSIHNREVEGKCIGHLKLGSQQVQKRSGRASITFLRKDKEGWLLLDNFTSGDFVMVGTLWDVCVGFGTVKEVCEGKIKVEMEREILGRHSTSSTFFVIDKVTSSSIGSQQFVYLSRLMEDTVEARRLRDCLIKQKSPVIDDKLAVGRGHANSAKIIFEGLNQTQRSVIKTAFRTNTLLLVRGTPGCGKTKTVVSFLRLLSLFGKSVLITAYTNTALDNILLELKKCGFEDFLRVGSSKLYDGELGKFGTSYVREEVNYLGELRTIYDGKKIIATTLLSLKHPLITNRKYDYLIVDEASQALPSMVIGAMIYSQKWIIFGDPHQLPAVLRSRQVKQMSIEENLFILLKNPDFFQDLNIQYRMNQVIQKFANSLLYGEVIPMRCGSEEQATSLLCLGGKGVLEFMTLRYPIPRTRKWLCSALSKKMEKAVVFLDTKEIALDSASSSSSSIHNLRERDIVIALVDAFLQGGRVDGKKIGVIAPYRGQVNLLRINLDEKGVEVNTVDQYQGREKSVIIVSCTKSVNEEGKVGGGFAEESILNDIRRLSVAITRAKHKLIIIGNSCTLSRYPACITMLSLLSEEQIYTLSHEDFEPEFFNHCIP